MDAERIIWLNNKLIQLRDAKINVLAPTSQFGANVFEGIRCYWNSEKNTLYAFRVEEHFSRLKRSIKLFKMDNPYSEDDWLNFMRDTIHANGYKEDIAVRMTMFIDGFGNWASTSPTGMFISPIPKGRKEIPLINGATASVSTWRRISDNSMSPHIKVGANYINSRYAQLEALQNGFDTAVFLNETGKVAEGPGSCLFIVRDGVLITPLLTASVLESITRDTLLTIAKDEGIPYEIRDIDRTELYIADEVFLCGSAAEITPILSIDGYKISLGTVGDITQRVHRLYIEAVTGANAKYREWVTII